MMTSNELINIAVMFGGMIFSGCWFTQAVIYSKFSLINLYGLILCGWVAASVSMGLLQGTLVIIGCIAGVCIAVPLLFYTVTFLLWQNVRRQYPNEPVLPPWKSLGGRRDNT